jgi:hypothetical protein
VVVVNHLNFKCLIIYYGSMDHSERDLLKPVARTLLSLFDVYQLNGTTWPGPYQYFLNNAGHFFLGTWVCFNNVCNFFFFKLLFPIAIIDYFRFNYRPHTSNDRSLNCNRLATLWIIMTFLQSTKCLGLIAENILRAMDITLLFPTMWWSQQYSYLLDRLGRFSMASWVWRLPSLLS